MRTQFHDIGEESRAILTKGAFPEDQFLEINVIVIQKLHNFCYIVTLSDDKRVQ